MPIAIHANNGGVAKLGQDYYFEPLSVWPGPKEPDGTGPQRTRFFLVWNGFGRYVPGTLKIWKKGVALKPGVDFEEEDNGLFYNFAEAPAIGESIYDYLIGYKVRPADWAFSHGLDQAVQGEEYFCFPNWLESHKYLGDGFWYGKYLASQTGNPGTGQGGTSTVPKSMKFKDPWVNITKTNASAYSLAKPGSPVLQNSFHMGKNAEWSNIAMWCRQMDLYPAGNSNSGQDGMGVEGTATADGRTQTGSGPVTWNHNLRPGGIADMVGNVWEWQDDFELRSGVLWFPNKETGVLQNSGISYATNYSNTSIQNSIRNDAAGKNECIPAFKTGQYILVKGNDTTWSGTGNRVLTRGESSVAGTTEQVGLFVSHIAVTGETPYNNVGFRLSSTLGQ